MASHPIVFVRHGESEANVHIHNRNPDADNLINRLGDPELSELGKQQAEVVGKALISSLADMGNPSVDVLISRYSRAQQTSEYFVSNYQNIENINITGELIEYTPLKIRLSQLHLDNGIHHDHNWESFKDRIIEFCKTYIMNPPNRPIIVFGHSLYISCIVSYISSRYTFFPEKDEMCFRFPNCSITTFLWDLEHRKWIADHVASIAHMPKDLITGTHTSFGNIQGE
jgi:broad specificity phosphatase PhoE